MILRIFRARVRPGQETEFRRRLEDEAIRLRRSQPGLLALHVGRLIGTPAAEIAIVSIWRDLESVQAFTGARWEEPVIFVDRDHFLEDISVQHYEEWGESAGTEHAPFPS